jgi:hypothetical protein
MGAVCFQVQLPYMARNDEINHGKLRIIGFKAHIQTGDLM